MPTTTTVTWQDLIDAKTDDLADLRDAYEEVAELAREDYGDDALNRPADDDRHETLQQQAAMYERAARNLQRREHLLETLRDELGADPFEIKMLSAEEVMDTEVQLRGEDGTEGVAQQRRNNATVNAAVVDAPEGVPRDDDGSPKPSEAPNALVDSLFDAVQRYNTAGTTDFRAEGFGSGGAASPASGPSGPPSVSATRSKPSAPREHPETEPDESDSDS
jgi:hypothetical protein